MNHPDQARLPGQRGFHSQHIFFERTEPGAAEGVPCWRQR